MKKCIQQQHPEVICDKYPLLYSSSTNNSDQTKLIVPYFRTTVGVSSLPYQGYKMWNAIPSTIKQLTNINLFTKKKQKTNNTYFREFQNKALVTTSFKDLYIIDNLY